MTRRYVQILSGVVVNTILADPSFRSGDGSIIVQSDTAQVGYTYDGTSFTPVTPPAIVQTAGLTYQMLTQLFTAVELTAIMAAAISKPIIITWLLKMASFTGGISLSDTQVTTAVNYLVAQGLVTSVRGTAILAGTIVNPNA